MSALSGIFNKRISAKVSSQSLTAVDEPQQLEDAMRGVSLIMDDDVAGAEKALSEMGNSAYHKLGLAVTYFLRAALGFEHDVIKQASERLAAAEAAALDAQQRSVKKGFRSHIYSAGTEYALCNAEAQIMSAVVSVLNESLTESIKGFYKVRSAIKVLESIEQAERKYLDSKSDRKKPTNKSEDTVNNVNVEERSNQVPEEDYDDDFVDAEESPFPTNVPQVYRGHVEKYGLIHDTSDLSPVASTNPDPTHNVTTTSSKPSSSDISPDELTEDDLHHPIDLFIYSGRALHHGMLLLLLSLVPPTFSKILSVIGFRGNRTKGLQLLWRTTRFGGINAGMGGLILLGFYSGLLSLLDITPEETVPWGRCEKLLKEMRGEFPKNRLWMLEESRMNASKRRLPEAVKLLESAPPSELKQVEALKVFEYAMNCMFLHRYEDCAKAFVKCVELNNWSHGLYYYIAAACYIELYRNTLKKDDNSAAEEGNQRAQKYANRAEELLDKVKANVGKKKFLARQLPFDVFTTRKINKWSARAKSEGSRLVDAVGVSPIEEIIFFFAGYRRMRVTDLAESLTNIASGNVDQALDLNVDQESLTKSWKSICMRGTVDVEDHKLLEVASDHVQHLNVSSQTHLLSKITLRHHATSQVDERAVQNLLRATIFRHLHATASARSILHQNIIDGHTHNEIKKLEYADVWPKPVALYEMAVCAWVDSHEQKEVAKISYDKSKLRECKEWLEKASNWGEGYDLDTRIGLKITTGKETLRGLGVM